MTAGKNLPCHSAMVLPFNNIAFNWLALGCLTHKTGNTSARKNVLSFLQGRTITIRKMTIAKNGKPAYLFRWNHNSTNHQQ